MAGKTEIGALNVRLAAEASEFNRAVDNAQVKLGQLGKAVARPMSMPSLSFGAIESAFAPLRNAVHDIPAIGAAIGDLLSPGGFFKAFKEEAKSLLETEHQAKSLGLRMGQLIALEKAAWNHSEQLGKGLQHLTRELGAVSLGNAEAAKRFEQFGFNAQKLANMPLGDAMETIAKQANKITDPFQKNKMAFDLFGKSGQQLIPMLDRLSAGLSTLEKQSIAQGLVPTGAQMNDVKAFLVAEKNMEGAIKGMRRQAILAGAPLMAGFAINASERPGATAAAIGGFGMSGAVAGGAIGSMILPGIGTLIGAGIGGSLGLAGGALGVGAEGARRRTDKGAAELESEYQEKLERIERERKNGIDAILNGLEKQRVALTESAAAAAVYEAAIRGATDAEQKAVYEAFRLNEELGKIKAAENDARFASDKLKGNLNEMAEAYRNGKLSTAAFGNELLKTMEHLEKMFPDAANPSALTRGSQADRSFGINLDNQQAKAAQDPADRLNDLFARADAANRQKIDLLRRLVDVTKNNGNFFDRGMSIDDAR